PPGLDPYQEAPAVAKSEKTKRPTARAGKARAAPEPGHHDLIRRPDITAPAVMRFTGGIYVRVTHPDYRPREVAELLRQGPVQPAPLPPGQVGPLILNGFPYTVLGYYTFWAEDADYEQAPAEWSFHGASSDEAGPVGRERRQDKAQAVKPRRRQGRER